MRGVDFIIVGQGIAGSCLALEFLNRGKSAVIFDEDWKDAACLVAAGVINPITGQRLVKSWRSSLAHPYAKNFYESLESQLHSKFYHPRKILQLCKSDIERGLWNRRIAEPDYIPYIGGSFKSGIFPSLNDSFGSFEIEHSAWVETQVLMEALKKYFLSRGILFPDRFDYCALEVLPDGVKYGEFRAKKIIFADGWRVLENPFFSWLPYRPAKGEILTLKSSVLLPPHVIHRGNWIMKCSDDSFRIGSTWDRENLNSVPTSAARAELLKAVPSIICGCPEVKVSGHSAGVRPCTATTRPHLGAHPEFSSVLSFNGFGSKGYALSPYFAREFADWILSGKPLDSEADLSRHIKKFYKPVGICLGSSR